MSLRKRKEKQKEMAIQIIRDQLHSGDNHSEKMIREKLVYLSDDRLFELGSTIVFDAILFIRTKKLFSTDVIHNLPLNLHTQDRERLLDDMARFFQFIHNMNVLESSEQRKEIPIRIIHHTILEKYSKHEAIRDNFIERRIK